MKSERGKLIIVFALFVAAFGIYLYFGRSPAALSDSVRFVCVATGKTHRISRSDLPSTYPARNPSTGEKTLLPCRDTDGKLYVAGRWARYVRELEEAKVNRYVDPQTLEVLESPRP